MGRKTTHLWSRGANSYQKKKDSFYQSIPAGSGMETDMYKKRMIMAVTIIMAVCFMTACAQKPNSEERGGIRVAVGDSGYQES